MVKLNKGLKKHLVISDNIIEMGKKWGVFMNVNRVDKVFQIYKNNSARKVKLNGNKCRKDELDLSSKAVEYQSAFIKIKELPEIRENKVKKIGNEIKTGNYKIDGENIVDRIIERINFDKRI